MIYTNDIHIDLTQVLEFRSWIKSFILNMHFRMLKKKTRVKTTTFRARE